MVCMEATKSEITKDHFELKALEIDKGRDSDFSFSSWKAGDKTPM